MSIRETLRQVHIRNRNLRRIVTSLVVFVVLAGSFGTTLSYLIKPAAALNEWSSVSDGYNSNINFSGIALSSDGQKIVATSGGGANGYVYTSSNGGTSFTEQRGTPTKNWTSVAASSDDTKVVGIDQIYGLFTSTDGGVSWTHRSAGSIANWGAVKSSANGSTLVVIGDQNIYISKDSGATWNMMTGTTGQSWYSADVSADGNTIIAAAYGGSVIVSHDAGVSVTSQTTLGTKNWTNVSTSGNGLVFTAINQNGELYTSTDGGQNWTQQTPPFGTLNSLVSSYDGSKIYMTTNGGQNTLFVSVDQGVTWNAVTTGASVYSWGAIATSSNGSKIVLAGGDNGAQVTISNDGGTTWGTTYVTGARIWKQTASSADGMTILASTDQYLYRSKDGGQTWTQLTSAGIGAWDGVAVSSDGTIMLAMIDQEYGYTSTDSGDTWTQRDVEGGPGAGADWKAAAISANGSRMAVAKSSQYIYTSSNYGATWTKQNAAGTKAWTSLAMSADGTKLVASANNAYVYTSSNSGVAWTTHNQVGSGQWSKVASSQDGSKLMLMGPGGNSVYLSSDSGSTWTAQTDLQANGNNWKTGAISADGSRMIVASVDGSVASSTDGGITWDLVPGAINDNWSSITMDSAGQKAVLVGQASLVWSGPVTVIKVPVAPNSLTVDQIQGTSAQVTWTAPANDGGAALTGYELQYKPTSAASWTTASSSIDASTTNYTLNSLQGSTTYQLRIRAHNAVGDGAWLSTIQTATVLPFHFYDDGSANQLAASSDGTKLIASADDGNVYTSPDSGGSWQQVTALNNGILGPVSISNDGTKMALGDANNGYIYTSEDSGATWTEHSSIGADFWYSLAYSANGSDLYALGSTLQVSHNNGQTWTQLETEGPSEYGYAVNTGTNGDVYLATTNNGGASHLKRSSDGGVTFTTVKSDTNNGYMWLDGSGNTLTAAQFDINTNGSNLSYITSPDNGQTWLDIGITSNYPIALSGDGSVLYMFKSNQLLTTIPSIKFTTAAVDGSGQTVPPVVVPTVPVTTATKTTKGVTSSEVSSSPTNTVKNIETKNTPQASTDGQTLMAGTVLSAKPTFSGYASPGASVTVTVHSDPVTCTATADANGFWQCGITTALPAGNHSVLVAITNADGTSQQLGPYAVSVADVTTNATNTVKQATASIALTHLPLWVYISSGIGIILIITIIIVATRKRSARQ